MEEMGLVHMQRDDHPDAVHAMAKAIRNLETQPNPSERMPSGFLDGLSNIAHDVATTMQSVELVRPELKLVATT